MMPWQKVARELLALGGWDEQRLQAFLRSVEGLPARLEQRGVRVEEKLDRLLAMQGVTVQPVLGAPVVGLGALRAGALGASAVGPLEVVGLRQPQGDTSAAAREVQ